MTANKNCPRCGSIIPFHTKICPFCDSPADQAGGVRAYVPGLEAGKPASSSPKLPVRNALREILEEREKQQAADSTGRIQDFVFVPCEAAEGWTVCGFTGAATARLTIPSRYQGLPVVEIGRDAFRSSPVASILLPSSVRKICEGAFRDCRFLYEIADASGLCVIEAAAFHGCGRLSRFPALRQRRISATHSSFAGCYQLGLEAESACAMI